MYDMYPDWGPAKHAHHRDAATEGPSSSSPSRTASAGADQRDNAGDRPDDN